MKNQLIQKKIELLSPAKNALIGIEAINHGADAVYIGAPKFGARMAASNSIEEIERLSHYAHQFGAKVHVTLNTILTDSELDEVNLLINKLYQVGIDALIIQDIGILKLDLPPIELHASTQMDNRTIEKIQLLENLGFDRAVLARELSLEEIKDIRAQSSIELEAFVHGALCVSYSGQCYVSQSFTGRSANKGMCAQLCRLPFTLKDQNENIIEKDQHLLSLKDMDRSSYLEEMITAGITSFKIEGRLKDLSYVKNITGFYRKKIDAILENRSDLIPSSFGKTTLFFEPHPEKTFHRDKTDYFLTKRGKEATEINTPKSIGEKVGKIIQIGKDHLVYKGTPLQNGDGALFKSTDGTVQGFRINKMEGEKLYPASKVEMEPETVLYRNFNQEFEKKLDHKSSERKINIYLEWIEVEKGFMLSAKDERGCSVSYIMEMPKEISRQNKESKDQIIQILQKLGNTIYQATKIEVKMAHNYFIPVSQIATLRRTVTDLLDQKWNKLNQQVIKNKPSILKHPVSLPEHLSYLSNVMNSASKKIYFDLGVKEIDDAFEKKEPKGNVVLMQCKYCIKFQLGFCPKQLQNNYLNTLKEPFILEHQKIKLQLEFDCQACVMKVFRFPQK